MAASRLSFLAAALLLLATCAGCIGVSSPVSPVVQPGSSRVGPYVEPDAVSGTLEGELRRGVALPPDEEGLDTTEPWPDVQVEIFDATGQPAGSASSDAQGQFRLGLPAGDYRVVPRWPVTTLHRAPSTQPIALPTAAVSVAPGAISSVRLVYNPAF